MAQQQRNWFPEANRDFGRKRTRRSRGSGQWRRSEGGRAEVNASRDTFLVLHVKKYEREAPSLDPPTVLGSFSVDSKKNICYDNSMMPVLSTKYIPDGEYMKVDMDLNIGWHRVNKFTGTSADGFGHLLQWILKNQDKVRAKGSSDRLAADFVCSRRMLKQIMQAPYAHAKHNNAEWVLLAKYFKGTIYLINEVPEQEKCSEAEPPSLMDIYGHKFEQYMTGGDPDDILESDCQFRCVLQLNLNKKLLLFAPDTDGVDPTCHKEGFKDMKSFVRLKTRLEPTSSCAVMNYKRFLLNNWWIENKLSGVPRLLVGTRNPEGVVHTLQMLQTDNFPSLAEGEWEPSVCTNVLDLFLDFVKKRVAAEPHVVHRFEKSAPAIRHIRHYSDPHAEDILPNWYKQRLFVTNKKESDFLW